MRGHAKCNQSCDSGQLEAAMVAVTVTVRVTTRWTTRMRGCEAMRNLQDFLWRATCWKILGVEITAMNGVRILVPIGSVKHICSFSVYVTCARTNVVGCIYFAARSSLGPSPSPGGLRPPTGHCQRQSHISFFRPVSYSK
jgi:hypothetical protein